MTGFDQPQTCSHPVKAQTLIVALNVVCALPATVASPATKLGICQVGNDEGLESWSYSQCIHGHGKRAT